MVRKRLIALCVSEEERSKRFGVGFVNLLTWSVLGLLVVASFGSMLIFYAVVWLFRVMFAEFQVRRVQALGTAISEKQFPEIAQALQDVCDRFGLTEKPRVIIINDSQLNAFAMSFAKRRVVVLLSETVEGILESPEELRFVIGHEIGHHLFDFSFRGYFELYKSAAYKAARELSCDNIGHVGSGSVAKSKQMIKRLAVGNVLHPRLDEQYLVEESDYLYSGFSGWLLKQYFTYPTVGKRLANVDRFAQRLKEFRKRNSEPETADEVFVDTTSTERQYSS